MSAGAPRVRIPRDSDTILAKDRARRFTARQSGGRPQRFCSPACWRQWDAAVRRRGRATVRSRRARSPTSSTFWRSGVDAVTGRRVPVAIKAPAALAVPWIPAT